MWVFKKVPLKRPTAEECHEHRWLAHSDFIQRKRERAVFLGNRLKVILHKTIGSPRQTEKGIDESKLQNKKRFKAMERNVIEKKTRDEFDSSHTKRDKKNTMASFKNSF